MRLRWEMPQRKTRNSRKEIRAPACPPQSNISARQPPPLGHFSLGLRASALKFSRAVRLPSGAALQRSCYALDRVRIGLVLCSMRMARRISPDHTRCSTEANNVTKLPMVISPRSTRVNGKKPTCSPFANWSTVPLNQCAIGKRRSGISTNGKPSQRKP